MELSTVKTTAREVEFVLDNGQSTGLMLKLRYKSADEVQKVNRKYENDLQQAAMKGRGGKKDRAKANAEYRTNRVLAHVAGWRWLSDDATFKGEQPEFSKRSLQEMLDHDELGVMLRDFIDDECGDAEDFFED